MFATNHDFELDIEYSEDSYDNIWALFAKMIEISDKVEVQYTVVRLASFMIQ